MVEGFAGVHGDVRGHGWRSAFLITAAACAMSFAPFCAAGAENDPVMARTLWPLVAKRGVPALAAAVVSGEGEVRCAAVGVRKRGCGAAATADDLWHLGSDTKAMTAALVGLLVEEGALAWDTRVAEVFPELASTFHPGFKDVTVFQLLAHRGGVKRDLAWGALAARAAGVKAQRVLAVREGLGEEPESPVGTKCLYSNLGYVIVGAVIERKTGRAWEEVLAERVFKPLGMTGAGFGGVGTPGQLDQPWGHVAGGKPVEGNGPEVDIPELIGPCGRVHCTLRDWAKFAADQLRGAQGKEGLLKAATYRRLQTPAGDGDLGLGWVAVERPWGGGTVLTHSGCNTMNYAVAWLAPKRNFAVLVCCNQGDDEVAPLACDDAASALIGLVLTGSPARSAEKAWQATWERFYLPRTHLFYDYLTSYEPGRELAHLPTADEVERQDPNECGYGTGMEDCMISAGVMLDLLADRYAVTGDASLRALAREVFEGVRLCATAHGVPGFLARAVCSEDLASVYPTSSRDQYTHAVHGLWRYFHSDLSEPGTRAEISALLVAIADRMRRNVTPENGYDALRVDGARDARGLGRMWNVKAHEAARLPMLYAAAWDVTGQRAYYDLYRTYVGPAVEQSAAVEAGTPTYALLQMQVSLELLEALETDAALKGRMRALMAELAARCAGRAASAGKAALALDLTALCTDWRTGEGLRQGGAYRKAWYAIRESGEAALAQLTDGATPYPAEQQALLRCALVRLDYDRVSSCGIFALQAAYWKARRRGLLDE